MFSRQLEYSYLMYMYLKENSLRYVSAEEILKETGVPKRWGRILLGNMVSKQIINSAKGRGYCFIKQEISFWKFYSLIEKTSKTQKKNLDKVFNNKNEKKYRSILLKIGSKLQEEMININI